MTALTKANPGITSWEIEDYLTENMVFLNGFRDEDESASLGAYGTVISLTNLMKAFDASPFTKEEWLKGVDYWEGQAYLAPTFSLLALWVLQLIRKKEENK
jgi:hypothetical protein